MVRKEVAGCQSALREGAHEADFRAHQNLPRFVDVPEEKAANIALGTVASKARAALIDACAAYREQDSQVERLATQCLQSLPVP